MLRSGRGSEGVADLLCVCVGRYVCVRVCVYVLISNDLGMVDIDIDIDRCKLGYGYYWYNGNVQC